MLYFGVRPDGFGKRYCSIGVLILFSYSIYNEALLPTKIEVDNLHSDIECDDINVDISSEQDETCKCKRGSYRYYSEAQK